MCDSIYLWQYISKLRLVIELIPFNWSMEMQTKQPSNLTVLACAIVYEGMNVNQATYGVYDKVKAQIEISTLDLKEISIMSTNARRQNNHTPEMAFDFGVYTHKVDPPGTHGYCIDTNKNTYGNYVIGVNETFLHFAITNGEKNKCSFNLITDSTTEHVSVTMNNGHALMYMQLNNTLEQLLDLDFHPFVLKCIRYALIGINIKMNPEH